MTTGHAHTWGWGKTIPKMTLARCHNTRAGHSTPETTPEKTPDSGDLDPGSL